MCTKYDSQRSITFSIYFIYLCTNTVMCDSRKGRGDFWFGKSRNFISPFLYLHRTHSIISPCRLPSKKKIRISCVAVIVVVVVAAAVVVVVRINYYS